MNETEIAIKFKEVDHSFEFLEDRVDRLENQNKTIMDLTSSVQKMAYSMEGMLEEQKRQREDIDCLKLRPAKQWNSMVRTFFTALVSTLAGGLTVSLINLIANNMK